MAFYFSVFLFWSGHNHTPKEKSKSAWVYPLQPIRFKSSSLIRVGEPWRWPIYSQPSSNRTVFYNLRYRLKLTNLYSWKRFIRFERIIRSGRIIREDDYDVIVSRTVKMVNLKMIYSDLISWPEQTIWTRAERTRTLTAWANFLIPSFKLCERTILLELSIWNSFDVHLSWKSRKRKLIFWPKPQQRTRTGTNPKSSDVDLSGWNKNFSSKLHPYFHWNMHLIRSKSYSDY